MDEEKNNQRKDLKTKILLFTMIIIIICLVAYIICDKFLLNDNITDNKNASPTTQSIETTTKQVSIEDKIKANFLADIEKVKNGVEINYILCNETYNCRNIDKINIQSINYNEKKYNGYNVYNIKFFVECLNENQCFYNEQWLSVEGKIYEASTYYAVDNEGAIVEALGNIYGLNID